MKAFFASLMIAVLSVNGWAAGDPFETMAKQLAREIKKIQKPRVALLSFPYHDDKLSSGSSIVSERLTTRMAELKGIRVIERSLINQLLEEQHLSESGVIDPLLAKRLGTLLNVDVLISGTLIDLKNDRTEVNARAMNANSGEIIAAGRMIIPRTWADKPHAPRSTARAERVNDDDDPPPNEAIEVGYPIARPAGRRR